MIWYLLFRPLWPASNCFHSLCPPGPAASNSFIAQRSFFWRVWDKWRQTAVQGLTCHAPAACWPWTGRWRRQIRGWRRTRFWSSALHWLLWFQTWVTGSSTVEWIQTPTNGCLVTFFLCRENTVPCKYISVQRAQTDFTYKEKLWDSCGFVQRGWFILVLLR